MDNCRICSDADKLLEKYIESLSCETSHHRRANQENRYGYEGTCCSLCSNGPCSLLSADQKGVCGADIDTVALRNLLRQVAAGSGCYIHIAENAAKELLETAKEGGSLRGIETLERLAKVFRISGHTYQEKAEKLAKAVLEDIRRPSDEKMQLIKKLAYDRRLENWTALGIMPGGAKDEVFDAVVKTSANLNSDPENMMLHCLRLGISTGAYGLVLTNLINDIIMGEGKISFESTGLKVIDPEYINIMVTGHQHALFKDLENYLVSDEAKAQAAGAGAKGFKIAGAVCAGQDFQLRNKAGAGAFCGYTGNSYTSEAALSTGCIDMVVSDFGCTLPGIESICEDKGVAQLCIDDAAKKANADHMEYTYEDRREISMEIARRAAAAFERRRPVDEAAYALLSQLGGKAKDEESISALLKLMTGLAGKSADNPMSNHGADKVITGVTEVTLKELLGGSYRPLVDLMAAGKIKGIAAVAGCTDFSSEGHDVFTVELTKKLIAKDILVLSAGCTCGGLSNCGMMSPDALELAGAGLKEVCANLGIPPVLNFGSCLSIGRIDLVAGEIAKELDVDIPDIPIVLSSPQWLEEQALADGIFGLTLGLTVHIKTAPFAQGSPFVMDMLENRMKEMTGGALIAEAEVNSAAEKIEAVITQKRKGIGI